MIMAELKINRILKALMEKNEISLRKLSQEVKIPQATLSSYLAGKKETYAPKHLQSLATYFNTSIDYLLFGKGKKKPNLKGLPTEKLFAGWLKVSIERAIPEGSSEEELILEDD